MNAYTETHKIEFVKFAKRNLNPEVIQGNMVAMMASVGNKSMTVRGWTFEPEIVDAGANPVAWTQEAHGDEGYKYTYYATATFSRPDGQKPMPNEVNSVVRTLSNRAAQAPYGKWTLNKLDGSLYTPTDDDEISGNVNSDMIGYVDVEMPDDWADNFSHLFGRDAHIARVRKSLEAAIMSGWTNRFHSALIGPPGCGKSDICQSVKRALGDDAVMEFDATATTAAGAIKDLTEREILPRILVVEEIEKADEKTLGYLLGIMDMRGEIRKTTARTQVQRNVRMVVIATVNNLELFEKIASGALASRFANKIGFSRPTRDQLAMILAREVTRIGGDERWIKPALDYCEEHDINDPRSVISICLVGGDDLLSGAYQEMMAETALSTVNK